jgi:hypothetical protein
VTGVRGQSGRPQAVTEDAGRVAALPDLTEPRDRLVANPSESAADRPRAEREAHDDFYAYSVPFRVGHEQLLAATQAWDEDNGPFPER